MSKKYAWWQYALTIGLLLLISILVIFNLPVTQRYAANYISGQITDSLGNYVKLEQVEITSLNTAEVKDLVVKDKENRIFLKADQVDIKVSLWDLIRGQELAGVEQVTITKGEGNLIQDRQGRWNYEDFTERETPPNTPSFQGKVVVKDSALNLDIKGKKIAVEALNATGDLKKYDDIPLVADFKINGAHFNVNGTAGNKQHIALNVEGNNVKLMDYLEFVPAEVTDKIKLHSGEITNLKLAVDFPKDEFNLKGYVRLSDLALDYQDYALTKGEALVNFSGKDLRFFIRGLINGADIKASGTVYNYATAPEAQAELQGDKITVAGYTLSKIKANLRYAEDKVFVDKAALNFAGGEIWGTGYYDIKNQSYAGNLNMDKVRLSDIPIAAQNGIAGIVKATGVIQGKGTSFDDMEFNLSGEVNSGYYQQIPWQQLSFNVYKKGSVIHLGALNGELSPSGSVTANGTYDRGEINVQIFGTKVDLNLVNIYFPQARLQGSGNFYAEVQGDVNNPTADIVFDASKGSIMARPFDDIKFIGHLSQKKLTIERASLNVDDKPIYEAHGEVDLSGGAVNIDLVTRGGRIENILRSASVDVPLTGDFDNVLQIRGTMSAPELSGHFKLWDGGYEGILLQEISGDYKFANGVLELPSVDVITPFVRGRVSGTVTQKGEFNLQLLGNEINMARLPIKYPYPITGTADFSGTLTGSIDYPIFQGRLEAEKLEFNHQPITNVSTEVLFRDNLIQVDEFEFNMGEGSFDLNAKYNIKNQWIFVMANVNNVDSASALALANMKNSILKGAFNGTAQITGNLDNPVISVSGNMPTGSLKDFPLQNIELELEYSKEVLKLKKFFGQQNEGKVGAVGEINFNTDQIKGQLSANNIDPNLFVRLADQNFDIHGAINGDLQVKGTIEKPDADFSVYLKGNGQQFDQGYILGNLKNNIIYINQGVISRGASALKTYGTIPLAALSTKHRKQNMKDQDQMNMRMYLENTDLNILPSFVPWIEWATGQVKGNVVLQGTVAKPIFKGSISTENAVVKFKYLTKPFTDINGAILFQEQQIKIEDFSGYLGNGYFKLTGAVDVNGAGISNYQGALMARSLEVNSPYYKGLLTGDASIMPVEHKGKTIPKLAVNLSFNDVTVSMPPLPENSDAPLPLMALDVNVAVGKNVRAYNPLLYDLYLNGGFSIKGTTAFPQASGEVVVDSGTVNVLKNIFQVNVGSIRFNQFGSYFPTLDFKASTKIDRTKVFVSITGPVDKELNTRLYSEPQMSEADIIKLLAFRSNPEMQNRGDITENDILTLATMGLQMSFLSEIEDNLRNLLHLDVLNISRDTLSESNRQRYDSDTNEVYNIQIGKYISDKVLLKYTYGINYNLNRIGLQYDLNKNVGILGEYDKDRGFGVKLEMQWKF